MLIDGEKYACDACVRGHRVSNCNHSDRELQHIAKKGRPVSQCQHCRTLRKSRSAHVKCDCADNKHSKTTCALLKDGKLSQKDICCCSHGGKCACSLKKEHLESVPESDSDECCSNALSIGARPRAQTARSEATPLTVFTENGHHKPAVKHNQAAHKCGLPYPPSRAHTVHGASPGSLANRSVDSLPHTLTIDALHGSSHLRESMVSAQQEQRQVKSEHSSPVLAPANLSLNGGQLPSAMNCADAQSMPDFGYPLWSNDFVGLDPYEQPMFSAAATSAPPVDWSAYDLNFNNPNFAMSDFSQAPSYTGFDFPGHDRQPALTTTSTSGEISEVEEPYATFSDPGVPVSVRPSLPTYGSDASDHEGYHLSQTSSFIGMPQIAPSIDNDASSSQQFNIDDYLKLSTMTDGYVQGNTSALPVSSTYQDSPKYMQISPFEDNGFLPLLPIDDNSGLWSNGYDALPVDGTLTNDVSACTSEPTLDSVWLQ